MNYGKTFVLSLQIEEHEEDMFTSVGVACSIDDMLYTLTQVGEVTHNGYTEAVLIKPDMIEEHTFLKDCIAEGAVKSYVVCAPEVISEDDHFTPEGLEVLYDNEIHELTLRGFVTDKGGAHVTILNYKQVSELSHLFY